MDKPVLSQTQRAWLQEIGIDARMLAHFSRTPFAAEEPVADAQLRPGPESALVPAARVPDARRRLADVPAHTDTAVREELAPGASLRRGDGPVSVARLLKQAPPMSEGAAGLPQDAVPGADSTLASLREHAARCVACELHQVRGRTVFGEGVEAPQWMFVGEAPGEYDESVGMPFQGRAGELLQAMLGSIGATSATPMYFTNVLKCRPMGNRSPEAHEIAACLPLLRRQISLLRPACLVALGRVAAGALLGGSEDFEALRGSVHEFVDDDGRRIPVVVTHHPASLLLHAHDKADAWRDLNLLRSLKR